MTVATVRGSLPHEAEGLYDPAFEHDACGVAFVATLTGVPSHDIIMHGLHALRNLDHRGATGADPKTGDGAGILMQIPDELLRSEVDFELPRMGAYAVGNAFLPIEPDAAAKAKVMIEQIAEEERLTVLGWRVVPTDDRSLLRAAVRDGQARAADGHRPGSAGLLPAASQPARGRRLLRLAVGENLGLQGHADHRAA